MFPIIRGWHCLVLCLRGVGGPNKNVGTKRATKYPKRPLKHTFWKSKLQAPPCPLPDIRLFKVMTNLLILLHIVKFATDQLHLVYFPNKNSTFHFIQLV